jgi:hypothetical protein
VSEIHVEAVGSQGDESETGGWLPVILGELVPTSTLDNTSSLPYLVEADGGVYEGGEPVQHRGACVELSLRFIDWY